MCPSDHDRPRERLLALGPDALTDAELVALHLGTGRQGEGVLDLAQRLLDEWGGIAGLSRTQLDELMRTPGVGQAKAGRLVAAFALADRSSAPQSLHMIRRSADIAAVAIPRIGRSRVEKVLLLVLDGGHRVRHTLMVGQGGATASLVPVREVLGQVLRHDGVAFAVAHNHPSGSLEPSAEDLAVTDRLRAAAEVTGLRFLDHVIVSGDGWRGLSASR